MPHPVPLAVVLFVHAGLSPGCGPSDPASLRAAEVTAILEAHLEHEDALLDILERNRLDPTAAETQLAAYLSEHGTSMSDLCAKRRQLETEPRALAVAMRELEPEMRRVFARRGALGENAPELMAREKVRTALAALDAL